MLRHIGTLSVLGLCLTIGAWGCGKDDASAGDLGFDTDAALADLPTDEYGAFCDWATTELGQVVGIENMCNVTDDTGTPQSKELTVSTATTCKGLAPPGECTAQVTMDCVQALGDDPCQLFSIDACDPFRACSGSPGDVGFLFLVGPSNNVDFASW